MRGAYANAYRHAGGGGGAVCVRSVAWRSYFGSYNVAYSPLIAAVSGQDAMQAKWGNEYSYFACPRANIFRRDANNIGSLGDLQVRAGLRMTASGGDGRVRAWGSGSCGTTSGRRTRSRWGRPRGASPRATTWSRTPRTADAVRAATSARVLVLCVCVSSCVHVFGASTTDGRLLMPTAAQAARSMPRRPPRA